MNLYIKFNVHLFFKSLLYYIYACFYLDMGYFSHFLITTFYQHFTLGHYIGSLRCQLLYVYCICVREMKTHGRSITLHATSIKEIIDALFRHQEFHISNFEVREIEERSENLWPIYEEVNASKKVHFFIHKWWQTTYDTHAYTQHCPFL